MEQESSGSAAEAKQGTDGTGGMLRQRPGTDRLMTLVDGSISDGRALRLIERFLHQEIMSDMVRWQPTTGTPQGAVISPIRRGLQPTG